MRTETRTLVAFLLIACIPPWIGWSLLTFGVVPKDGPWQALYLTGWAASTSGLLATYMIEGRRGVRRLLEEAVRVRVPIRWWLFILFVPHTANVASVILYFVLRGQHVVFNPSGFLTLVSPGMIITFFLGPFGEEFGWRGFLLPQLVRRFSVLPAVLLVGVIWATWHWPLLYQSMIKAPVRELISLFATTVFMSILIGTVYLRTGSLLLSMIMHWNINSVRDVSAKTFPGLPNPASDHLLEWCGLGAAALVAAMTIPALLVVGNGSDVPIHAVNRDQVDV